MVCGIFAGVQKQVITHRDTSVLETYVMLLVLCKPSLGTITRTLRSRSVYIIILLSNSVNYFYMPIDWAKRLYDDSISGVDETSFVMFHLGQWRWMGSMFQGDSSMHWKCKILWRWHEDYSKCSSFKWKFWGTKFPDYFMILLFCQSVTFHHKPYQTYLCCLLLHRWWFFGISNGMTLFLSCISFTTGHICQSKMCSQEGTFFL